MELPVIGSGTDIVMASTTSNQTWWKSLEAAKGEGKAVSLQAWSGPEGSRKLRFPDFMTTAKDGGKVVSLTHRPPLPPTEMSNRCIYWG